MDMFNNEFRVRFNSITSPSPSSIRFSKARIESMLTSWPILDHTLCQTRETLRNVLTHIDNDTCFQLLKAGGSSPRMREVTESDDGCPSGPESGSSGITRSHRVQSRTQLSGNAHF